MKALGTLIVALGLAALGCRPDPGTPTYSTLDDFSMPFGFAEPLPGPDPYQEGIPRLAFGIFYEGDASTVIPVDDQVVQYFIFLAGEELSYSQSKSDDRIEGVVSDRLSHAGLTFWGGGVFSSAFQDFSAWTTLHISVKSRAESMASLTVGMRSESAEVALPAADYGFAADGQWHTLAVPLLDFVDAGLDLSRIDGFIILGGGAGEAGDSLLVDNLYLSQQP